MCPAPRAGETSQYTKNPWREVDVVICQGSVQDIACHYLNKYKIMIIKVRRRSLAAESGWH